MLELAATAWGYALAVTTVLFLAVLLVQAVARQVRSAARAVQRVAEAPASSSRELSPVSSRAA